MKGYKNSTKTQYVTGKTDGGPKGAAKTAKVMAGFKRPKALGGLVCK